MLCLFNYLQPFLLRIPGSHNVEVLKDDATSSYPAWLLSWVTLVSQAAFYHGDSRSTNYLYRGCRPTNAHIGLVTF